MWGMGCLRNGCYVLRPEVQVVKKRIISCYVLNIYGNRHEAHEKIGAKRSPSCIAPADDPQHAQQEDATGPGDDHRCYEMPCSTPTALLCLWRVL